jgi:hypothetical protein
MPLLVVLAVVGVVGVFRRGLGRAEAALRILIVASATGMAAVLFYGWIADRYLADFLPFVVLAACAGIVLLWRRLIRSPRWTRAAAGAAVVALGVFGIAANVGIAIAPSQYWTAEQAAHFLTFQKAMSDRTGHPLTGDVHRGDVLPEWAPAGSVFVAGQCDALYLSNGEDFSFVPSQYAEHDVWMLVEAGLGFEHGLHVTVGTPTSASRAGVVLATIGRSTLLMHSAPESGGAISFWFSLQDPRYATTGAVAVVRQGSVQNVSLFTDRYAGIISVSVNGLPVLDGPMSAGGPIVIDETAGAASGSFAIADVTSPAGDVTLCHRLVKGR